jgi:hypothetical protein
MVRLPIFAGFQANQAPWPPARFAQIGPTNVADGQHSVHYHPIDVDGHAWLLLKMGQLHEVLNDVAGTLGVTIDNGGVFTRFGVEHFAGSRKNHESQGSVERAGELSAADC